MLTSFLKVVLFLLVMTFYSVGVWRTVNEYFGKEFKTYIQLDSHVRHDKELRALLMNAPRIPSAPDAVPPTKPPITHFPPVDTTLTASIWSTDEANNYNEQQKTTQKEAKQITGDKNDDAADDFLITVKSIKHPTSNAKRCDGGAMTNHDDDDGTAMAAQHPRQCLSIAAVPPDWQPSLAANDGNAIRRTAGDDA